MDSKWILAGLLAFSLLSLECVAKPPPKDEDYEKWFEPEDDVRGGARSRTVADEGDTTKNQTERKGFRFTTCQGHKVVNPESFLKAETTCEEEKKKAAVKTSPICYVTCIWEKMEFIHGEKKKLDTSAVDEFVDAIFTGPLEHNRDILKTEWTNCKKSILDEDEDDKNCKRFKPYFMCVVQAFDKLCVAPTTTAPKGGIVLLSLGR